VDYLTWDEDDAEARSQALSADLPSGVDTTAGWDGHGRQSVVLAVSGEVVVRNRRQAAVPVQVRVLPYTRTADDSADARWQALPQVWRTLQVPVALVSGQVVVTGSPAYVGQTTPPPLPSDSAVATDSVISRQTRSDAEAFFAAYADGDTTAYTAPGVDVVGLRGQASLAGLESWSVHTGASDTRDATATVRWRDVTGAVLTQSYQLRLVRIAASNGSRWFIDRIGADLGNGDD
jgi:hypothetical protein